MRWRDHVRDTPTTLEVKGPDGPLEITLAAGQIHWREYPLPVWSQAKDGGCYESARAWVTSQVGWASVNKRARETWRTEATTLAVAYGRQRVRLRDVLDARSLKNAARAAARAAGASHSLPDAILLDVARAASRALEGHLETTYERGWPEVVVARGELIAALES